MAVINFQDFGYPYCSPEPRSGCTSHSIICVALIATQTAPKAAPERSLSQGAAKNSAAFLIVAEW